MPEPARTSYARHQIFVRQITGAHQKSPDSFRPYSSRNEKCRKALSGVRQPSSDGRQIMTGDQLKGPTSDGVLRLTTLGDTSLICVPADGEPEELFGPGKPLALLVYLCCSPGRSATREHLIDLLWTNLDLDGARHALRQALWYLRKHLGRRAIRSRGRRVVLTAPIDSDYDRFLEAVDRQDFEQAVELYRGEFLPMFAAPGGAGFEHWGDAERHRLRTQFLRAAESLVRDWTSQASFEKAQELAARARDADRFNESTWRLLIETCLAGGDPARARIEAYALERTLQELGQSPEPETRRLIALAREEPLEQSRGELGYPFEPELVGREREFATVLSAWRAVRSGTVSHIHVTGPAGVGKSRLLSEAETRLQAMEASVVQLRAAPGERDVTYALASDLAATLADMPGGNSVSAGTAGTLVALNPGLSVCYDDVESDQATEDEALRHRIIALAELVGRVAEERSLALLVDDVHWADPASRQLLVSLLERLERKRVLVITSARPGLEGTVTVENTQHLLLEPLSVGETRALLAGIASLPTASWADGFPARLRDATGGSPLLIVETLRFGLEEGWLTLEGDDWGSPDPSALTDHLTEGEALRRRLESLAEREASLLLLLCVAGAPLSATALSRAADCEEEGLVEHLQELELRGLATSEAGLWSPAHDEFAAMAMQMADAEDIAHAHLAIGSALAETAGDDLENLCRAGQHLDRAGAVKELKGVFRQWARLTRRRGDRRPLRRLAAEFLAVSADDEAVSSLIDSLPFRIRLPLARRRGIAAAGALAAIGIILAGTLITGDSAPPEAALFALLDSSDGTLAGYHVPITRAGWEEFVAIKPAEHGEPLLLSEDLRPVGPVVPNPSGDGWAYAGAAPDSGEVDVFWMSSQGRDRRLTRSPGDDEPLSWSPDGTKIVFQTARWGDNPWHDLAVLHLETGRIQPLTGESLSGHSVVADEKEAHWSPDGTRIAFRRSFIATEVDEEAPPPADELCWITVDSSTERRLEMDLPVHQLVGWSGPREILAILGNPSGLPALFRIDIDDGETRLLDDRAQHARISPDGSWVASYRRATSGISEGWYLFPRNRPDLAVPLETGDGSRLRALGWSSPGRSNERSYLARIEILAPNPLTVGVPSQLRIEGFSSTGVPMTVQALTWGIEDTSRATLDLERGLINPKQPGRLTVHASAGGWRRDTLQVAVQSGSPTTLLTEDWDAELVTSWVPYGTPYPTLSTWSEGGKAYWNRSNDAHYSGVYSRREFAADHGLGLEVWLSTPRTAPRAQDLSIALKAWTNPVAVEKWDHRTGSLPLGSTNCQFKYPAGDGYESLHRARTIGGTITVDSVVPTGDPYRVRLQLFPDGTCGVALNGEPLERTTIPSPLEVPHRVAFGGKSLETKLLVGPLKVWDGIRDDVDWSTLKGWSVTDRGE